MSRIKRGAKGRRLCYPDPMEVHWDTTIMLTGIQYQFKCYRCGSCCVQCHPIGVSEHELPVMAEALGMDGQEFQDRYLVPNDNCTTGQWMIDQFYKFPGKEYELKQDWPCPFFTFDGRGCTIYEARPATCRMYPFAFPHMVDVDWSTRTITFLGYGLCPALGDALRSFESNLRRLNRTKKRMMIPRSPADVYADRCLALEYLRALMQGYENDMGSDGLEPQEAALLEAYKAYLRLCGDGWRLRFAYQRDETVHVLPIGSGKHMIESIVSQLAIGDSDINTDQEVISNAV